MLNCGCIMCEQCVNKPFMGFAGKCDGKCPVCDSTVFKDQCKTKIGGMMLRNKVAITPRLLHCCVSPALTARRSAPKRWRNGMTRT